MHEVFPSASLINLFKYISHTFGTFSKSKVLILMACTACQKIKHNNSASGSAETQQNSFLGTSPALFLTCFYIPIHSTSIIHERHTTLEETALYSVSISINLHFYVQAKKKRNLTREMCLIINTHSLMQTRAHGKPMQITHAVQLILIQVSYPERKFQILSSPDLHAHVISAQILKVGLADGKQASCHSGRPVKPKAAEHWQFIRDIPQHQFSSR